MPPNDRPPPSRQTQVSKKLSWLLRHGATSENLPLHPGGYALVSDVLSNRKIKPLKVSLSELKTLVRENDKQRFSLIPTITTSTTEADGEAADGEAADENDDASKWLIRANQGHSLKLEGGSEELLTPIDEGNMPGTVVHGTTHGAWVGIVESGGLKTMGRNHVHFASGLPSGFRSVRDGGEKGVDVDVPVISGMRNSSTVLVFLDLNRAMQAGIKFGLSENGVILTEGNADGLVPLEFFASVEDRTGEGVLVENGKVVKDAPAAWARKGKGRGKGLRQPHAKATT